MRLLGAIMLLITAISTAACGVHSTPEPAVIATHTSSGRTRPTPEPAVTVIHIPSGPVTPTPAALAGREDCPEGWAAFVEAKGAYSMCYPPELRAWVVGFKSQELQLGNSVNHCDAYIDWEPVHNAPKSDMERAQHICAQQDSPFDRPEKRPTIMELNGTPVASCVIDGWQKPSVPNPLLIRTVQMELPWGQEGMVTVDLGCSSDDLDAGVAYWIPILATIRSR